MPDKKAHPSSSSSRRPSSFRHNKGHSSRAPPQPSRPKYPVVEGPLHDSAYVESQHGGRVKLSSKHLSAPKSSVNNWAAQVLGKIPQYETGQVVVGGREVWRTTVQLETTPPLTGIGDDTNKSNSVSTAALSLAYQLNQLGTLDNPPKAKAEAPRTTALSDGTVVTVDQARAFMDYYCRKFGFERPDIKLEESRSGWGAFMEVGGRRIGIGKAGNKKNAETACYLDVTKYLESCDPELWKAYVEADLDGTALGMAPRVFFEMSEELDDEVRDLCVDIRKSQLFRKRPVVSAQAPHTAGAIATAPRVHRRFDPEMAQAKSARLSQARNDYLENSKLENLRKQRMSLPVFTKADELLAHVKDNDVTICMAATGSGKTTQIPQLILDSFIEEGQGASCNIVCTQPRRLAALSVADRVAKERGETVGNSVGYQVRFEAKLPEENGSITFCTTGVFLKRMQSSMSNDGREGRPLDDVTHVVVDEVHERDVDTDLLLVVLKQLMEDRKRRNIPLKVILMSATIDPTLFQNYFLDDHNRPARVISIPGRSFPVEKHFMNDFIPTILKGPASWIMSEQSVSRYIDREMSVVPLSGQEEDLDLPAPLVAATVAHVLQLTDSGHVLVFLPGWEDITAVQKALLTPKGPLGINFNDSSQFSIHLLHSTIPLAEQQVIFEPPSAGVRRIILSTNIAETSVTIPDVVYVVDSAKVKEQRYDPQRHMSSLVSAWVGSSNLNQRAGRAGRHRPGDYYGLIGKSHADALQPYQTVEMKRVDLSNVVMHVKALNFPGMTVEDVLAACIEPPLTERVAAAMKDLQMVGALDAHKNLSSLGRVLLQIPVDVQLGRLVLYGCFFRCLDQALTLAAILSNRDSFVSPMHLKAEASKAKMSWSSSTFRSDALAAVAAYNAWWAMQSRGEYVSANRFCSENFLSKPTLLTIQKVKSHLLQSLFRIGVIDVSAGTTSSASQMGRSFQVPPVLNVNGSSQALLAALIAIASQPKFAIQTGDKSFRTAQDKMTFIHPSSVNNRKHIKEDEQENRQLFAFMEKRQNATVSTTPQTMLVTTTKLDPLTYMLFGAYKLEMNQRGIDCDGWLPIVGKLDTLDDVYRLKTLMESSMLRVFEGITMSRRSFRAANLPILPREEAPESETDDEVTQDLSMSREELKELEMLTRDIVRILNRYSAERESRNRTFSRPVTPYRSGFNTPRSSRPATPSRFNRLPF